MKTLFKAQLTGCAFLILSISGFGQTEFSKTFDYSHTLQFGFSIQPIDDSSFLIQTNASNDTTGQQVVILTNVTDFGNIIFQKKYQEPLHDLYGGFASSMRIVNSNTYEFGGTDISGSDYNGWLVKLNSNGDTIFTRDIGNNLNAEIFYNSTVTMNGDYLLTGIKCPQPGVCDVYAVRTDSSGKIKWEKSYNGGTYDIGNTISEISENQILIGSAQFYNSDSILPWIIITDSIGNITKQKVFTDHQYHVGGCYTFPTGNHNILWCGWVPYTYSIYNGYTFNCHVTKLDSNFNIVWQTIYQGKLSTSPYSFRQLSDSSIVIVGYKTDKTQSLIYGWIAKLNKNGKKIWDREYTYGDSRFFNYFSDFQKTRDGGYIICGSTLGDVNQDLWVVKLDSNGCLVPGCDSIATGTIEVSDHKTEIRLYPNPATNEVNIEYNIPLQDHQGRLTVYNLNGQPVF